MKALIKQILLQLLVALSHLTVNYQNSGAGAFGARPTVVEAIILDVEAAKMAIPTLTNSGTYLIKATFLRAGI